MTFQEFGEIVEKYSTVVEVEPFVYKENKVINTVVFEFNGVILTLFDDGTYDLENN